MHYMIQPPRSHLLSKGILKYTALALVLLFGATLGTHAQGPAVTYSVIGIAENDTLIVRSRPDERSSEVTKLRNGYCGITISGEAVWNGGDDWIPIRFSNSKGWVRPKYLAQSGPQLASMPDVPTLSGATAPESSVTATISDPDGFVNIRQTASADSAVVAHIKEGERFITIPAQGDWWWVRTNSGATGFVHSSRIVAENRALDRKPAARDEASGRSDDWVKPAIIIGAAIGLAYILDGWANGGSSSGDSGSSSEDDSRAAIIQDQAENSIAQSRGEPLPHPGAPR